MLKSIWLDGKRNWRVDHLIYVLVNEFISEIEHRHKQQMLGMEGPNLGEKCHQQILTRTPETPVENIRQIADSCFEVQSSNSKEIYEINLDTTACSYSDFPCIRLCTGILVRKL